MSGIAGVIDLNKNSIKNSNFKILRENICYRAHDGFQDYRKDNIALIYAKLCVTEQCVYDKQPIFDKENKIYVVSNSRLDNRTELLKKLKLSSNKTDCELIYAGFLRWRKKVVDYLIGPFSFVIFDEKNNYIFPAVDHFAQKPLYLSFLNNKFIFSSDPKAISLLDQKLYSLNTKKLIDYLVFQGSVKNESFFNKIIKINKAQYVEIKEKKLSIKQYYSLPITKNSYKGDCSKEIKRIFSEVITAQCRSNNNKISTTSSGGLDSTSIASLLNKKIRFKDINSFSVHFDSLNRIDFKETDEKIYVQKYQEKYDANHKYITSKKTPLNYLNQQLKYAYFPPKSGNGYLHQEIIDEMKKNKIRVLFDGFDGDSVISHGAEYLIELGLEFKLKKLLDEVKKACELNGRKFSKFHTLKNFWLKPLIPFSLKLFFNNIFAAGITEEKKFNNLSDEAKKITNFDERFRAFYPNESYKHEKSLASHRNALNLPFWEEELEIIDFIASINGIDFRLPFMDKRVIEFCLSVPGEEKFNNGITRAYFRKAMKNITPKEVLDKHTKANLGPVIMNEIRDNYEEMLKEIINSNTNVADLFKKKRIKELYKKEFSQMTKLEKVNIYKWYVLEKWLLKNNFKIGKLTEINE